MQMGRVLTLFSLAGLVALLGIPAGEARFMRPELDDVPIAKLIENLDRTASQDPKDAKVRYNLARAYAMAYADKSETVKVWKDKENQGVWFGYMPKYVPFTAKMTDDPAKQKQAKEYLDKAVATYKSVLKIEANNLPAQLGLGWCLEQDKKKDEAIKVYRDAIEEGWKKEMDLKSLGLGGNSITVEAAGYLIPLLDKDKDQQEITTLQERVGKLRKLPRPVTPVVIPLRDGLTAQDMVNPQARVRFDADGSGLREEWTWFTKHAGILVYDPHARRSVTSALQWFGNVTFWMAWDNGYEALRSLDDNGDGKLSGQELVGLAVWIDANSDGVCQPGEVKTLAELGIVSLSCRWEIDGTHPDRIACSKAGVTFQNGHTRPTFDVILRKR